MCKFSFLAEKIKIEIYFIFIFWYRGRFSANFCQFCVNFDFVHLAMVQSSESSDPRIPTLSH